jgi:hypothetical protein
MRVSGRDVDERRGWVGIPAFGAELVGMSLRLLFRPHCRNVAAGDLN